MKSVGYLGFLATAYGAKVLMVLTSTDKLGDADHQTGWYLPEAAHPYNVFKEAGVTMVWASPEGGEAPLDPSSVDAYKEDKQCVDFHTDEEQAKLWKDTVALKDITKEDIADFDAVFVVGGFGVMGDLVTDADLQKIAASIYEDDGVVSGVCHGPAALVGVKLSDGTALVEGKKVACFTNAEEEYMKKNAFDGKNVLPGATCEDAFSKAGAKFTKDEIWTDHVAASGRLITGQNPQSAKSTAEAVVTALGLTVGSGSEDESKDKSDEGSDDDDAGAEEVEEKFAASEAIPRGGLPAAITYSMCGCLAVNTLVVFVASRRTQVQAPPAEDLEEALDIHHDGNDDME